MKTTLKLAAFLLAGSVVSSIFTTGIRAEYECGTVYSSKKNDKMMISLTFDDGPHPGYTPKILDILSEYGITATFFTVGENALYYPAALERCMKEGHEIANHTYSHKDLSHDSVEEIENEVIATEKIIYENFDVRTKLLRPPGGLYGKNVIKAAANLDYTLVLWNIDTKDWAHTSPEIIAANVLDSVKPGDIILMHDFIGRNSPTPEALKLMIPELLRRGYKFVTVSELLGSS